MARLWLLLTILLCVGCENSSSHKLSFYHWESEFKLSAAEKAYLEKLQNDKIYLRFFDLKLKDGKAYPEAILHSENYRLGHEIIPTIYLTNAALLATAESGLGQLADNMLNKCTELWQQELGLGGKPKKLQLDCDWTAESGNRYFALLRLLKEQGSLEEISSTLRLHQVKFSETTGVPPVDKVVLMFYNMGELDNPLERNSILNIEIGKEYLARINEYPLPMEVALPAFTWGVHIRAGKVMQLLNNFDPQAGLKSGILNEEKANQYLVAESGYLAGTYLYRGDHIRHERVTAGQLEKAINLLEDAFQKPFNLVLYHLQDDLTANYAVSDLRKALNL